MTAAASRHPKPRSTGPGRNFATIGVVTLVVGYLVVASVATLQAAGWIDCLSRRQPLHGVRPGTIIEQWQARASDPAQRRKLMLAMAMPALAMLVVLPAAAASMGQRRRALHGSARFATLAEVRAAGLLQGKPGIVVGRWGRHVLVLPGQQSVMLSAPTRSGKGVGVVVPNLLSWPGSVVVADIKGENHRLTAGFRARHGQTVRVWAPFAEDGRSHRFNPLGSVRAGTRHTVGDILVVAQVLYPTDTRGSGTEAFFNEQARNLFLGLALLLVETPELPRTLGELLRQSSGKGQPIRDHLTALIDQRRADRRPLSDTCTDALGRFLNTSDNTLTSILATLTGPLTVLADPFVDAATSADDIPLQDLRRRPWSVYVCIPPNRLADAAVLLNLFFSLVVHHNTQVLPEDDASLRHPCLLVLDEFTAMGRVAVLARAVGYLAGYDLRLLTVIQAVSQLDAVYGEKDARTFATNHALQILYAPREQRDANEYSEMLGTLTEASESRSRSHSTGGRGGSSQSRSTSPQRRPLLLPQEFKELGTEKAVLVLENCKPILVDKIRFHADPLFAPRVLPPPGVPRIDVDLHRARVERRVRPATTGEAFTLEQLAVDLSQLPALGPRATDAEVRAYVDRFFEQMEIIDATAQPDEHADPGPDSPERQPALQR